MTRSLKRLLRTLACIHGRSAAQVIAIVGGSLATFKRDVQTLRQLGVKIVWDREAYQYCIRWGGVFDLRQVGMVRL